MFGVAALWPVFRSMQTLVLNLSPAHSSICLCKLLHMFRHRHSAAAFPVLIMPLLPQWVWLDTALAPDSLTPHVVNKSLRPSWDLWL